MYKKTTKIKTIKELRYGPDEDSDDSNEENNEEVAEGIDIVLLDVPLMIRLLEYAREEASSDVDLHNLATRLITKSNKWKNWKPLTMKDYDTIVASEPPVTPAPEVTPT
jgi:hypothetical protein